MGACEIYIIWICVRFGKRPPTVQHPVKASRNGRYSGRWVSVLTVRVLAPFRGRYLIDQFLQSVSNKVSSVR
jgi:hypothetical protein